MKRDKSHREYPPFYEKFVPLAIGLLAVITIAMLIFTVAVGLGLLRFG